MEVENSKLAITASRRIKCLDLKRTGHVLGQHYANARLVLLLSTKMVFNQQSSDAVHTIIVHSEERFSSLIWNCQYNKILFLIHNETTICFKTILFLLQIFRDK